MKKKPHFYAHRVNTIEQLKNTPTKYGVEIDLRDWGDQIILKNRLQARRIYSFPDRLGRYPTVLCDLDTLVRCFFLIFFSLRLFFSLTRLTY